MSSCLIVFCKFLHTFNFLLETNGSLSSPKCHTPLISPSGSVSPNCISDLNCFSLSDFYIFTCAFLLFKSRVMTMINESLAGDFILVGFSDHPQLENPLCGCVNLLSPDTVWQHSNHLDLLSGSHAPHTHVLFSYPSLLC